MSARKEEKTDDRKITIAATSKQTPYEKSIGMPYFHVIDPSKFTFTETLPENIQKNLSDYIFAVRSDDMGTFSVFKVDGFKDEYTLLISNATGEYFVTTPERDSAFKIDPTDDLWKRVYGEDTMRFLVGQRETYTPDVIASAIPTEQRSKYCIMFFGQVMATADSYEEAQQIATEKYPNWMCHIYVPNAAK